MPMLCKNPYVIGAIGYGCGQCLPCRINRRRLWSHRLVLEARKHERSCFTTLTYDDDNIPVDRGLCPRHCQLWLKKLRKALDPIRIRYYLVGEYGERTWRPHYHVVLFGVGTDSALAQQEAWRLGHIVVGDLTVESAAYCTGYVVKKMTKKEDERLLGRHPEFCRMSLRPGIGASAMEDVAESLNTSHGALAVARAGDVPASLAHGGQHKPLGRYLRAKLREHVGIEKPEVSGETLKEYAEALAWWDSAGLDKKSKGLKALLVERDAAKVRSIEVRYSIFSQRKEKL